MAKTPTFAELQAQYAALQTQQAELNKQLAAQLVPLLATVSDRLAGDDITALIDEFTELKATLPEGTEDATQVGNILAVLGGVRTYFAARHRDLDALVNPPIETPAA